MTVTFRRHEYDTVFGNVGTDCKDTERMNETELISCAGSSIVDDEKKTVMINKFAST